MGGEAVVGMNERTRLDCTMICLGYVVYCCARISICVLIEMINVCSAPLSKEKKKKKHYSIYFVFHVNETMMVHKITVEL